MYKKNVLKLKKAVHSFRKEIFANPYLLPYMGNKYKCPVCNTGLSYFNPIEKEYLALLDKYEYNYSLFHNETFNFLDYHCPKCYANDRDRLYAVYFLKKTQNTDKSKKVNCIDFAPSPGLSCFLRSFQFLNYRTADLYLAGVDDQVDIRDMSIYKNDSIDIFICSHVLEHVDEDRKAMQELYRILRPGGWGITMVPILTHSAHIIEDAAIVSEADKWKYYGQGDHVRFYNREGFIARLQDAGFRVKLHGADYFGANLFEQHGIHPRSVLYIVEKL